MRNFLTFIVLFFSALNLVGAQQSKVYTDELASYNQALDLYQEDQYTAAQRLFKEVKASTEDELIKGNAAYYIANCAVRLNQRNADALIEKFVEEYPASTKRNSAVIDVADYYFDNGKYNLAAKWYTRVNKSTLSRKQMNRYNFNTGYTLVQGKKYDEAKPYLNRVSDTKEYGAKAKYYLGYIAYEGNELQEASDLFDEAGESPEQDAKLSYYQADLNYRMGNFDEAIELAKEQMPKSNRTEQSELNRIIGQSLFNQEKYAEALPYLEEYKGTRGKWNNNDYYQLGYTYYKMNDFEKAIETFNKIIDGENATAQNAYYHLGQSYIKLDRNEDALNAFKLASEMEQDSEIQKDAFYNYAKLSYETGNPYESTPQVILNYLDKYPDTDKNEEMRTFLIDSYFTSKNYKEAMLLLEDGRINGNENIYGKVALYQGLTDYLNGDYRVAIENLDKALNYVTDSSLKKKAQFWKAESFYQINDFAAALESFEKVGVIDTDIEEDEMYFYDLGYTYFKLKQYDESISAFERFTETATTQTSNTRLNDALLRIGDANYVTKKYYPAMEAYNKSIKAGGYNADYAAFQKAISYGFVDKMDMKIRDLRNFIDTYDRSKYRDDVIYELGNTLINQGRVNDGIKAYDQLIAEFPNSSYTSKAMMRKGLQLYNDNQLAESLKVFKAVVARYPGTPQATQAIISARQVYIDQGNTNEYAVWVRGLEGVEVTDNELDDTAYESAERPYVRGDMPAAIKGMQSYLNQFPNGKYALKAHFYLAQAQFSEDQKQASIPHYEYVVSKERNEFTEPALARLSEILLNAKDYAKAIPVLQQLEQYADFPQNVIYAQSNLMKAFYEQEDFDQAASYAQKVLNNDGADANVLADAQVIIARSYWKQGNEAATKSAYEALAQNATGNLAAEAAYYQAYFENKEGNHDDAINSVKALTKNYGSYKLWSSKALVVMAQSYYAKGETLNATTILEAVIKSYGKYPEVVASARKTLNEIKTEEAKTNSSIAPKQ
ncbi:MAG: tetratricopeptide repeat protein [Nonlabens sp.]